MVQKVAIVGVGSVGQVCAFALMLRGSAREIVLVDRIAERAAGVATDMRYGKRADLSVHEQRGIGARRTTGVADGEQSS